MIKKIIAPIVPAHEDNELELLLSDGYEIIHTGTIIAGDTRPYITFVLYKDDNYKIDTGSLVHFILNFGSDDGAHHKQWVLDQVLRKILGVHYNSYIDKFENNGEYEWETGVAP